jgi:hypothetical protein
LFASSQAGLVNSERWNDVGLLPLFLTEADCRFMNWNHCRNLSGVWGTQLLTGISVTAGGESG